VKHTKNK